MRPRTLWALIGLALLASACSSRQKRPEGPPPEYERPVLAPWDSGSPVDPTDLSHVKREEVTDDEPEPALDGGTDAAAPPLEPPVE